VRARGPQCAVRAEPPRALRCGGGRGRNCSILTPRAATGRNHAAAAAARAPTATHLPRIGNFTDFYAGIHHATIRDGCCAGQSAVANSKYIPVAYHGRASSIRVSGTDVRRPSGQRKPQSATEPDFGPCRYLDYELELGVWIGPGNALGSPIPIGSAGAHVAGFCLLNDWSARDIQAWEYQPLGPFLAKNSTSTVSPWVVTRRRWRRSERATAAAGGRSFPPTI
jgi:fumarylacetoacetase